jgi:hypothetical protein
MRLAVPAEYSCISRRICLKHPPAQSNAEPRCGLVVVDLETGDLLHHMRIEGVVQELFDVTVLPGAIRPMLLGFKTDEIKHMVRFEGG